MGEKLRNIEEQDTRVERDPFSFELIAIFTSLNEGEPMLTHDEINAIAGTGLEGDRYAERTGAFSGTKRLPDEGRQVTLISQPGIAEANQTLEDQGIRPFTPEEARRNLVVNVDYISLNARVGRQFRVGNVLMEGVELCEPCRRPANLAGRPEDGAAFELAFKDKGGLRARILNNGTIHVGDRIDFL